MALEHALEPVPRLHAVRVLVLGPDVRFLRVSRVLLSRYGFRVETSESARDIFEVVERLRINVVVVDASHSLTAAARLTAALAALPSPVRVVVVSDRPSDSAHDNLRPLHKWSAFDQLVQEIETAYAATG